MKKVISFFILAVTICITACNSDLDDITPDSTESKVLSGNVLGANLMQSFHGVISRSSDIKDLCYPNYYGGAYLNKEGKLVVNVIDNTPDVIDNLRIRCGGEGFVVESCQNTYAKLLETAIELDNFLLSNKDNDLKFYGFSICDISNNIEIYLGDVSNSNINKFKNEITDKPYFKFVSATQPKFQEELMAGGKIFAVFGQVGSYGSIGFRAKRTTGHVVPVAGFVTAGHVVKQAGTYLYKNNSLGTALACSEISKTEGNMDAAFCYLMNGNTCSNHLANDFLSINPKLASYVVNTPVALNGMYNSTSGYVTSTYASATFTWQSLNIKVILTGIVKMTCKSQSGDSGGIIYTKDDMNIAGTLIGGATDQSVSYFMPASRVVEQFGLELY